MICYDCKEPTGRPPSAAYCFACADKRERASRARYAKENRKKINARIRANRAAMREARTN